jgi:hypothetical protein
MVPEEGTYGHNDTDLNNRNFEGFEETKRSYGYEEDPDNLGGRNPHDEVPAVSSMQME